jgi:DedD protein
MAFFKFRKGGDASPAAAPQPESVEAMRRRARHRLIGAAVLVLVGVVGFPLLFDTQPRPIAVDIPIEIPDRNKAKPLPAPVSTAPRQAAASAPAPNPVAAAPAGAPAPVAAAAPAPAPAAAPVAAASTVPAKPEARASAPAPAAVARAEPATKPAAPDAARAQALLEGKPVQAQAQDDADGRFVVQVGAFADATKARETRLKVEKAGLKTYTHVAETKDGKRIRVRVGPFATRAEADKAAGRIKELELPAAVLTL